MPVSESGMKQLMRKLGYVPWVDLDEDMQAEVRKEHAEVFVGYRFEDFWWRWGQGEWDCTNPNVVLDHEFLLW